MSYKDIKDGFTEIVINGEVYKITYDFNAISMLEELYGENFLSLGQIIDDLKNKPLSGIIDFCYAGFLRHQPDLKKEALHSIQSFMELYDKCATEFLRCVSMPDAYRDLVYTGKEVEKEVKKKTNLKSLFTFGKH